MRAAANDGGLGLAELRDGGIVQSKMALDKRRRGHSEPLAQADVLYPT